MRLALKKLKVLIVDDSIVYRSKIRAALQDLPWIEVTGAAVNGRAALEHIANVTPDLLILDLEMPEMDGLSTLNEMRSRKISCKVIVFSSTSKRGADITLEALRLGASDFVAKPGASDDVELLTSGNPTERIKDLLFPKIHALFPDRDAATHSFVTATADAIATTTLQPLSEEMKFPKIIWDLFHPEIMVIGSSTGGPTVLEKIFSDLRSSINCPIVITQHMPPVFTTSFAERLGKASGSPAIEATQGTVLEKGCIYVAPGDYHLRLQGDRTRATVSLDQGKKIHSVRPSVDPLFSTAASIFKERCLALVLTGMGNDGRDGAIAIKRAGGAVIIQNKESCAVFGMPGAVFSAGAYDKIADPQGIVSLMREKIGVKHAA